VGVEVWVSLTALAAGFPKPFVLDDDHKRMAVRAFHNIVAAITKGRVFQEVIARTPRLLFVAGSTNPAFARIDTAGIILYPRTK